MGADEHTPPKTEGSKQAIRLAVIASLAVLTVFVVIGAAIAGSYALSLHAISQAKQQEASIREKAAKAQAALQLREAESSIRTSLPTCEALITMDDAKNGASNASNDPNSYGHRLARSITTVVNTTKCRILVKDVHDHVPYIEILKQLGRTSA